MMEQNIKTQAAHLNLPSRKSVEAAIKIFENFRDLCRHQMDLGYWATVDFPSKHHINRLLQLAYRNRNDLIKAYGDGLTRHIYDILPACKAYTQFLREHQTEVKDGKEMGSSGNQNPT